MLFYGPGNGDWISFVNQTNGDVARRAGVPASVIQDAQLEAIGRRFNWQGLTAAYGEREVKKRARRTALAAAAASTPYVFRGILAALPSKPAGPTPVGKGYRTIRFVQRFAPRALGRLIPYVGLAFIAYDVYTVTTRGELWGVKIWTEGEP